MKILLKYHFLFSRKIVLFEWLMYQKISFKVTN